MKKYAQPVLALVLTVLLFLLSFRLSQLKQPGQEASYATGYALGSLIMPYLLGVAAAGLKKAFSRGENFDWALFYWFVIGFCFISSLGKYLEISQL